VGADLVSRKSRTELREYFVGTTLSIISDEFDAADIAFDPDYTPPTSGARRSLVEQYYHSLDWTRWADVRKFLTVYENVLTHLEDLSEGGEEWATKSFASLRRWIERDGYAYSNGRLVRASKHALEQIAEAAGTLDLPELQRQVQRLHSSVESDPALAIGTAKELVETVCKTILEQRNLEISDDADIGQLVKEARKALGLIPESVPSAARGSETVRRLLSNLGNVAQGLGELRNLYGTGHGKTGSSRGLAPRHARLAVGAAATLATFLLETHADRGL
jgi:Abortive infection C-terminus